MDVFGEYAHFYDLLYKEKSYYSEAEQVDNLLSKWENKGKSLLVCGCGTGRHDACFYKMGYQIHGFDLSEDMISVAKSKNPEISYEVSDVRSFKSTKQFDNAVSLFHVMSYQNGNDDICNAFSSIRNALKKNGLFVFDVWYGPGVLSDRPSLRVKEVEDDEWSVVRIAQPEMHANTNIVDVNYKILAIKKNDGTTKVFTETHHMRYFFLPELEYYLKQAGFELLECVDCNSLGIPGYDSWTTYLVARAI